MSITVPVELFKSTVQEKKVYFFSSTKLNTEKPHYFICIKRNNEDLLILSCCTSQQETVQKYIETRNLPHETMVWIKPEATNPFLKNTFINCNNTFIYTLDDFESMYTTGKIKYSGEISLNHYSQIVTGIHKSPLIDEETKEMIPMID
jgi:hypothetical protein